MNAPKLARLLVVAQALALAPLLAAGAAAQSPAPTSEANATPAPPGVSPSNSPAANPPNPPAVSPSNPPAPSRDPSGPRGQIQGSAQIRRNLPVVGAVVKVNRAGTTSDLRVTTTDLRGAFKLDALPDGRYRVEVAHDGFATVVKDDVELRAPYRAVVEVKMTKTTLGTNAPVASAKSPTAELAASSHVGLTGSPQVGSTGSPQVALRGTVRDKEGRPSEEVRVRLVRDDGSDDPREAVTTARGEYAFDALTPGGWRLEIEGAGLLPVRTSVVLSEETTLAAVLVPQPADYAPAIEDLMPREEPIPPRGLDPVQ